MKIILSPSKTQDFSRSIDRPIHQPFYIDQASFLVKKLKRMSKKTMATTMSIKGDLLEETYKTYKTFDTAQPSHAIYTYTGLVYKYMNVLEYDDNMLAYLDDHLCILSALYGVLKPFDGIKAYRLDMKMSLMKESLYSFWKKNMIDYFKDETILDLASGEFSKMIPLPMTTVGFRDYKDGTYKNLATYSKMARGMLLDLMIKNQINDIESLKSLEFQGYHYNEGLSRDTLLIYSRND